MDSELSPLPTPAELDCHPELGPMRLLQASVELTIRCLIAAHPELCDGQGPPWDPPSPAAVLAHCLVKHLDLLSELLPEYRTATAVEDRPAHRPPAANPF